MYILEHWWTDLKYAKSHETLFSPNWKNLDFQTPSTPHMLLHNKLWAFFIFLVGFDIMYNMYSG